ncbi:hypothetical protein [Endozoicomonas euniceicola]|uniref:Metaxin glutathione S-transferase domain-containing protein n=1 Tax=Endozoicomonas euniceicola TaxID=1234143 RepID=A0ABY6GN20_9GAMM|nr:hypothetical protein [Endozoicomonas euniceicola]UYM14122.1 hypothetical protein NX720_14525 [Endozoicomonas euniceicola]
MIQLICDSFAKIPDHCPNHYQNKISLADTLMTAYAMMHLYRVKGRIPCDTYMHTILDPLDPKVMREPFRQLFAEAQREIVSE